MKHAQSEFKETLFDWDSEPALERPSRLEADFAVRGRSVRPTHGRINGLFLTIVVAVGAALVAIAMLKPLLRSISA